MSLDDIDAVYLPLPPALHFKWAKLALEHGKHVFVEKPSTTDAVDTNGLIELARKNNLAFHENYMFVYHEQLKVINDVVESGEIGDIRLYRISFGFPRRAQNDFRYNKSLGEGALIDAGGYTIKYGSYLLGDTAKLTTTQLNYIDEFGVDMYGSATMVNDKGVTAQLALVWTMTISVTLKFGEVKEQLLLIVFLLHLLVLNLNTPSKRTKLTRQENFQLMMLSERA